MAVAVTRSEVPAEASRGHHRIGAGDVCLASYLLGRVRGAEPVQAARRAAHVCAQKLEAGQVPKGLEPDLLP